MVSSLSLTDMFFTLVLIFLVPVGLVIYYYRKEKIYLPAVLVGALVFLVFQVLTRLQVINYLSTTDWFAEMANNLVFLVLFFALSAGIFEEIGRYLGFRFLLSKHLSWKNGVAFGIGHGGFEAMILVGTTYMNNLVMSFMINAETFEAQMAPQLGEMTTYYKQILIETAPSFFFLAGIERLATIAIHIALSVMVLYAVKHRKSIYLVYAVLLHTLINVPAVLYNPLNISLWLVEAYIVLFALGSIYLVKHFKDIM